MKQIRPHQIIGGLVQQFKNYKRLYERENFAKIKSEKMNTSGHFKSNVAFFLKILVECQSLNACVRRTRVGHSTSQSAHIR